MEGGSPELKTSLWVLSGWPSLEARVTSVKSAVHDERGSAFFCRNSALRLAFLLTAEGLFLFTASAAGVRLSLVSKEKAKVEPMVSEKVACMGSRWAGGSRKICKNPFNSL